MTGIISEPDDPWVAFVKGVWRSALALGIPLVIGGSFRFARSWSTFWAALGFFLAMTAVFALIAGCLCAFSSMLQRWAYNRVTGNPFK
jgi:hypothetical protein